MAYQNQNQNTRTNVKANNSTKKQMTELGCLWERESRNGRFFSGNVTINGQKTDIIVFSNNFKKGNDKAPDYRIYLSEPRESQANNVPQQNSTNRRPVRPTRTAEAENEYGEDGEIM